MTDISFKVALLGRPNVGKSTLFNRLIRSNRAITHDRPGITRDRMEGFVRSPGEPEFVLIDTGGVTLDEHARVEPGPEGLRGFEKEILAQAREAVAESALLCLVVDGREGLLPLDRHLADFLRKESKPLLLVINKVDGPEKAEAMSADFYSLGFDLLVCSAAHGYNVRALEEEIRSRLFDVPEAELELPGLFLDGASRRQRKRLQAEQRSALERDAAPASPDGPASRVGLATAPETKTAAVFDSSDLEGADGLVRDELSPEERVALLDAEMDAAEREIVESMMAARQLAREEVSGQFAEEEEEAEPAPLPAGAEHPLSAKARAFLEGPLRVAMLGRPNAGKSSLVNALVGEQRMIVSDVAGTTRDSVDVTATIKGKPCTFVDTAGVRRPSRVVDTVERYSVNSSLKSTTKAHVTVLVVDAAEGLTQQDKRLIDLLHERKTPFMLLLNKIDKIPADQLKNLERSYRQALSFCPHIPLLMTSAFTGRNLHRVVPTAESIRDECAVRISTAKLNRAMTLAIERHQPPVMRQDRPRFFYLTQAECAPPTFVFFVSSAERILPSYARYLERALRKEFSLSHAPMRIHFRSSHGKKGGKGRSGGRGEERRNVFGGNEAERTESAGRAGTERGGHAGARRDDAPRSGRPGLRPPAGGRRRP